MTEKFSDLTARDCLEDIQLVPSGVMRSKPNGEIALFISFMKVEEISHAEYVFQLLRTYYLVREYPRKPIVMIYGGFGRGTYFDSKKDILPVLRDRLSRVMG